MRKSTAILTLVGIVFVGQALLAQELPKMEGAVKEHEWLKKLAGEWEVKSKGSMGEGQPPIEATATWKSSMLGDVWLVTSGKTSAMGVEIKSMQMIGYDPKKKKYIGTWADSMNHYMWHYEGTVDKSGKKLSLMAEGPNFMEEGKTAKYRDAYEFKDDNTLIITSSVLNEDGKWETFMNGTGKRKKKK